MSGAEVPYTAWQLVEHPRSTAGTRTYDLGPLLVIRSRFGDRERLLVSRTATNARGRITTSPASAAEVALVCRKLYPDGGAPRFKCLPSELGTLAEEVLAGDAPPGPIDYGSGAN